MTMRHNCFHFAPLPPDPNTGRPRTAVCALANMHNVNLNMASALLRVFAPVVSMRCASFAWVLGTFGMGPQTVLSWMLFCVKWHWS